MFIYKNTKTVFCDSVRNNVYLFNLKICTVNSKFNWNMNLYWIRKDKKQWGLCLIISENHYVTLKYVYVAENVIFSV